MKDLQLTDVNGAAVASFRAEMLSNTPANIEILEIKDENGVQVDHLLIAGTIWRKLNYSWQELLEFCTTNNLKIAASDSNGSNAATLLGNQVPEGDQYAIVTADADTKTFLVATDVSADFLAGDSVVVYNSDNTIWGTFTVSANAVYGAPNTSIVVTEAVSADIAADSGKYIINNGQ